MARCAALLSVLLAGFTAVTACGGGSSAPGTAPTAGSAVVGLSASPNPLRLTACTPLLCSSEHRFLATGDVTVTESAGVGGRVDLIRATLRRDATNATLADAEFDAANVNSHAGSTRLSASGRLVITNIGVALVTDPGAQAMTLTFTVQVTDDRGNRVTQTLAVPVTPAA